MSGSLSMPQGNILVPANPPPPQSWRSMKNDIFCTVSFHVQPLFILTIGFLSDHIYNFPKTHPWFSHYHYIRSTDWWSLLSYMHRTIWMMVYVSATAIYKIRTLLCSSIISSPVSQRCNIYVIFFPSMYQGISDHL